MAYVEHLFLWEFSWLKEEEFSVWETWKKLKSEIMTQISPQPPGDPSL